MLFQTGFPLSKGFSTLHRTTIGMGAPFFPVSLTRKLLNEKSALKSAYFEIAASSGEHAEAVCVHAGKFSILWADKISAFRNRPPTRRRAKDRIFLVGSMPYTSLVAEQKGAALSCGRSLG